MYKDDADDIALMAIEESEPEPDSDSEENEEKGLVKLEQNSAFFRDLRYVHYNYS
ncbi:hypothetical protein KY284_029657 [Solanum tuberosum]|nr:hypothetical protein KY284_029657 [Solanum tuberosum]